jgi:hypothetical protein
LALAESLINKRLMMSRRFTLPGLLAVLLALAAQLGVSASVPGTAVAASASGIVLCHAGTHDPAPGPNPGKHPAACLLCPFCGIAHAAAMVPVGVPGAARPTQWVVIRGAALPPSHGPPPLAETPQYPRAPPITT